MESSIKTVDFKGFEKVYDTRHDKGSGHASVWMFNLGTKEWVMLTTNEDPYELVGPLVSAGGYGEGMLIAHGWASPYDPDCDGRPSEHADRQRVRLMIHVDRDVITCACRMGDQPLLQDFDGSGALYDAIQDGIAYAKTHPFYLVDRPNR